MYICFFYKLCYNQTRLITPHKGVNIAKFFRRNWQIQVPTILLISTTSERQGIKDTTEALKLAKDQGLDLVEVGPKANPPVCKIMDFGKFLYEQEKAERKHKAKQKSGGLKELRISLKIGQHDLALREQRSLEFLAKGNKVKISLRLIGREAMFADQAFTLINNFINKLSDQSTVIQPPKREGKIISATLQPKSDSMPAPEA